MNKVLGFTIGTIVTACVAVVALPVAIVLGVALLILACIGAGSGLAVVGIFVIVGAVIAAILLHVLLPRWRWG